MITPASILIASALVGLIPFIKTKERYYKFLLNAFIVFSLYINSGYFFTKGSFLFTYDQFLLIPLVIYGFLSIKVRKLDILSVLLLIALLVSLLWGFLNLINDPILKPVMPIGGSWDLQYAGLNQMVPATMSHANFERFIRVILFFIAYIQIESYIRYSIENYRYLQRFIIYTAVTNSLIGIATQFSVVVLHVNLLQQFNAFFLGVNTWSQNTSVVFHGGLPVVQGFMKEPSQYADSFLPAIFILFFSNLSTKRKSVLTILFVYSLISSGSFTGFALTGLLVVLYAVNIRINLVLKIFMVAVGVTLGVGGFLRSSGGVLHYDLLRLLGMFSSTSQGSGSDGIRMYSITYVLKLFWTRPLFGLGLGTTNAFGFIPSIISSVGIVGFAIWCILVLRGFQRFPFRRRSLLVFLLLPLSFVGDIAYMYSANVLLCILLSVKKHPLEQDGFGKTSIRIQPPIGDTGYPGVTVTGINN